MQEARDALFGGCAYVPDLPALAAWIEAAWAAGFDAAGAEQLGWAVQATQKWVGTTEAAALLRSFALRAEIVDFGVEGCGSTSEEMHPGVQCDGCGVAPIVGGRFCSEVLPNYDLCERCHAGQASDAAAAPFCRVHHPGDGERGMARAAAASVLHLSTHIHARRVQARPGRATAAQPSSWWRGCGVGLRTVMNQALACQRPSARAWTPTA